VCGRGAALSGVTKVTDPLWLGLRHVREKLSDSVYNERATRPEVDVGHGKIFCQYRWTDEYEVYALWESHFQDLR